MKLVYRFLAIVCCVVFFGPGIILAAETIKIGVAGAFSGDLASYGRPALNAVQLYVDEVNSSGGILGRQVELLAEDDVCKPEIATNTATKLVSSGVHVVVGHICSGATKAALGIYKSADVIVMSPSATNPDLTGSGLYTNFFRTIAPDDVQARSQVNFAINVLKVKRIAVIHDKGDYGKGLAEFVKKFVEESGTAQMVLFEGVTPGAVDYSAVVQKIKRKKAEAVIFGGYHPEASKIVMQMRRKRMKIPFISDDGVKDETFIKIARKYAEGVYATGPRDVSKNPLAVSVTNDYKLTFSQEIGLFSLNAYAAAQALLNGIAKAGSTDFQAVSQALRSEYVETPLGRISFDGQGDAVGVGFSIYQVQDGKYVELK